jgi:nucleoside-diphosphate-sugar epimerase
MSLDTSQTVFVTGGSGYIGRNVLRAVVQAGHPVRALARSKASAAVVASLGAEVTLNIDKARRELGYAPVISREQGLAELSGWS